VSVVEKGLSGFAWTFAGTGGQAIFQIVTLGILARLLSPAEFGVVGAAVVVTQFSNIFSELGVGPAIVQRGDLTQRHLNVGFTISILFGVLVAIAVYCTSLFTAEFFGIPDLENALKVYAIVFVFKGMSSISESLLQRDLNFKIISLIDLCSYIFGYATVGITLAIYGFGFWSLVGAHISQSFIKMVGVMLFKHPKVKLSIERKAVKDLLHFGAGLTVGRIANYLANQGDNLVIGRTLGAEALGSYGRAYQLVVMPANTFGQVFDKVLFPTLSKVQHDKPKLAKAYRKSVSIIAWVLIPFSIFIWELSPEIIGLILGDKWMHLIWPFKILSVGISFRVIHKISDALCRAMGAVYKRACLQSIYAILVIGGAWLGHFYNITGVALCVLVSLFLNYLMMAILSLSLTKLPFRDFVIAHLPGVLQGIVLYLIINQYISLLRFYEYKSFLVIILCGIMLFLSYFVPLLSKSPLLVGRDNVETFEAIRKALKI